MLRWVADLSVGNMSRSTCHAQRPEVSCREVLKLGNNKKDEESASHQSPTINIYQQLFDIYEMV
jgi:hypothetical protein